MGEKVLSYLKALGINPTMRKFSERKQIQKLSLLLQIFGFDVPFRFTWYAYGPYSPRLTRMLYDVIENGAPKLEPLSKTEENKIDELRRILGSDLESSDRLELIVSIHYLRQKAKEVQASDKEVIHFIKENKPYFTDEEIHQCWKRSIDLDSIQGRN